MRRTHILSVETTTIYLLLKYYPVENRLELIYRLKKELRMIGIENGDLLFMIFKLYPSVVSCFGIKAITKNMALF